jgi:dTDP-4-amino-4,6-dideoxygalactose transaminase
LFNSNENIVLPKQLPSALSSFHLFIIRCKTETSLDRKSTFEKLRNEGIFVNVHYIPIYRQPYYSKDFNFKDFPNSEIYYSEAISLPIYPGLKDEEIEFVNKTINQPSNFQNIF